jgi:hypothetical protein
MKDEIVHDKYRGQMTTLAFLIANKIIVTHIYTHSLVRKDRKRCKYSGDSGEIIPCLNFKYNENYNLLIICTVISLIIVRIHTLSENL